MRPIFSRRCSAGYNDPWLTSSAPFESCWMRWLIPHPCVGCRESVLRTRRSREPRRASVWGLTVTVKGSCSRLVENLTTGRSIGFSGSATIEWTAERADVYFPYALDAQGQVSLGEIFVSQRDPTVFSRTP